MRICFLILNPFDYDTRARLICSDLINIGWDVEIVATVGGEMPDYLGAKIHRLSQPVKPFRQQRFISYNLAAADLVSRIDCDVIHAVDLDTLWAATTASKHNSARVLYEARELYVELLSLYKRPLMKAFWKYLERRVIGKADIVVTINHSIAEELEKRYGIKRPDVVMNVAKAEKIQPIDLRRTFQLNNRFIIIYQGQLRPGQGVLRALRAISEIDDCGLVIFGDGEYRGEIEKYVSDLRLGSRVKLAGMIPPDMLASHTAGGDAGLLLMEDLAINNYLALPQKLFQYIEAGLPPIVTNLPELRTIVEADDLGLVMELAESDEDSKILKDFLENKLANAKQNCKRIEGKYSWQKEGGKLLNIYKGLV